MVNTKRATDGLDLEWLTLIMEAKKLGISMETVRDFLHQAESKELAIDNH